jgi:hypothetical protein
MASPEIPDLRRLFFSMLLRVSWSDCKVHRTLGYSVFDEDVIGYLESAAQEFKEAGGDWGEYT